MMRLGSIKKSLIIITSVLGFLVIGSVFLVYFQEDSAIEINLVPQKLTKEMKVKLIEASLSKIIHFETAVTPWPLHEQANNIQSYTLHAEGKITDERTECVPVAHGYSKAQADSLFDPNTRFTQCLEETPKTVKVEKGQLLKVCDEMMYSR